MRHMISKISIKYEMMWDSNFECELHLGPTTLKELYRILKHLRQRTVFPRQKPDGRGQKANTTP